MLEIKYWNEPVNIKCLLDLHEIDIFRLLRYANTAVDGKFKIDDNEYTLVHRRPKSSYDYSVNINGTIIEKLKAKDVLRILKIDKLKLSNSFKNNGIKEGAVEINGFKVGRVYKV